LKVFFEEPGGRLVFEVGAENVRYLRRALVGVKSIRFTGYAKAWW